MGGNSFPNTCRLSEKEYNRVCGLITNHFAEKEFEVVIPVEIKDKEQISRTQGNIDPYGDVDVIIARQYGVKDMDIVIEMIEGIGGSDEPIQCHQGSAYSVLSRERYQIDIKFCDKTNLSFLAAFESNNDFGTLMGQMISPLALKWNQFGLHLKLKLYNTSGNVAMKADFLLTNDIHTVCQFLSIPKHSLDGKTKLTCREIYDILTTCRAFFPHDHNTAQGRKFKINRKKRPIFNAFFNFLDADGIEDVYDNKGKIFHGDRIEHLFNEFRMKNLAYENYIFEIADLFSLSPELKSKMDNMKLKLQPAELHPKFNHTILASWFPTLSTKNLGKLFGKMKSHHSGSDPNQWNEYIQRTPLADIKEEAEQMFKTVPISKF